MKKIKVGTKEFQNGQQAQQPHVATQPKRKLVSLSDFKHISVGKMSEPEPLHKINMSDLVREVEA